jgi:hypothetical protein
LGLVGYLIIATAREGEVKAARMERKPQTTRERAMLLLRATLVPGWLPTSGGQRLVWTIRLAILLGGLLLLSSAVDKPLWSWLQLLIVPAAIAVGVAWLNWAQRERELEVEHQRAQDESLLKYLEQMGQLLKTGLRESSQDSDVRKLARAWTQTTLETLDHPRRKRSLLRFLYESQLICKDRPVVKLERARLQGVNLEDAKLANADLSEAWMSGADLRGREGSLTRR